MMRLTDSKSDPTAMTAMTESRGMTSLKRHFLKKKWFDIHTIFWKGVQLLSHKLLKISCQDLEPFGSYGEYPGFCSPPVVFRF